MPSEFEGALAIALIFNTLNQQSNTPNCLRARLDRHPARFE